MDSTVFFVTLAAEILSTVAVVVSILFPQRRIWPPSETHSWPGYLMWGFFLISAVGAVALGIVDWGSMSLAPWVRWVVGIPLWCGGNVLATWAVAALGMASTFGVERKRSGTFGIEGKQSGTFGMEGKRSDSSGDGGALVRRGPYRFSRNPQYVGFIIGLIGWAFVASSALTLVVSLVGVVPLVLVPFAEEPWLAARYGAAYEEYKRTVPRFIFFKGQNDVH